MTHAWRPPVASQWHMIAQLEDGVTRLTEPHIDRMLESNAWLVRGRDADLLVDTLNGIGPLRPAVDAHDGGPPGGGRRHPRTLRSRGGPARVRRPARSRRGRRRDPVALPDAAASGRLPRRHGGDVRLLRVPGAPHGGVGPALRGFRHRGVGEPRCRAHPTRRARRRDRSRRPPLRGAPRARVTRPAPSPCGRPSAGSCSPATRFTSTIPSPSTTRRRGRRPSPACATCR